LGGRRIPAVCLNGHPLNVPCELRRCFARGAYFDFYVFAPSPSQPSCSNATPAALGRIESSARPDRKESAGALASSTTAASKSNPPRRWVSPWDAGLQNDRLCADTRALSPARLAGRACESLPDRSGTVGTHGQLRCGQLIGDWGAYIKGNVRATCEETARTLDTVEPGCQPKARSNPPASGVTLRLVPSLNRGV
jgi:hypothetical protein